MVSLLVNIQTGTFKMQTSVTTTTPEYSIKLAKLYIYIYIYIYTHTHTHTHTVWREAGQFWGNETNKPNLSKAAFKGRKQGACHLPFPGILLAKNSRM